jgi:hypothetical protein
VFRRYSNSKGTNWKSMNGIQVVDFECKWCE